MSNLNIKPSHFIKCRHSENYALYAWVDMDKMYPIVQISPQFKRFITRKKIKGEQLCEIIGLTKDDYLNACGSIIKAYKASGRKMLKIAIDKDFEWFKEQVNKFIGDK